MSRMTGGQALIKSLRREGVRVVFGLPGVQLYHALDPLADEPEIRFISTRHEQAAAYMADGYARASGDVGTALVVPGPGLLNASAAIGTAYSASSPVLLVSGQIRKDRLGLNRGELHEVNDQLQAITPVTKWAARVVDPAEIPAAVQEAFRRLRTGRPRPVEIEVPEDTLAEVADIEEVEPGEYERPAASPESVMAAADILAASSRPLVWAGGGAISSGASKHILAVAEMLQAPVATSREGKGSIPESHDLSAGAPNFTSDSLDQLVGSADVILAVGTRLAIEYLSDQQQVLHIDIDPEEIGRHHSNTIALVGDARLTLVQLHRWLTTNPAPRPSRRDEMVAFRQERFDPSGTTEPQGSFIRAIRAAVPRDGIVVEGNTQVGYMAGVHYPVECPGTYLTSSYFGNLGFAYPTALGAKVARPDRAVVAISGDGGFLYNSQELATAVQYGINAIVVVFNDNAYGNVLRDQKTKFGSRFIGSRLHNPDFLKLAEAYGARGVLATDAGQLELAIRHSIDDPAPTLIEVPVGEMPYSW